MIVFGLYLKLALAKEEDYRWLSSAQPLPVLDARLWLLSNPQLNPSVASFHDLPNFHPAPPENLVSATKQSQTSSKKESPLALSPPERSTKKRKPIFTDASARKTTAKRRPLQIAPINAFRELLEEEASQRAIRNYSDPIEVKKRASTRLTTGRIAPAVRLEPSKPSEKIKTKLPKANSKSMTFFQTSYSVRHTESTRLHRYIVPFPLPAPGRAEEDNDHREGEGMHTRSIEEVTEVIEDFSNTSTRYQAEEADRIDTSTILSSATEQQASGTVVDDDRHMVDNLDDPLFFHDQSMFSLPTQGSLPFSNERSVPISRPLRSMGLIQSPSTTFIENETLAAPPAGQLPLASIVAIPPLTRPLRRDDPSCSLTVPDILDGSVLFPSAQYRSGRTSEPTTRKKEKAARPKTAEKLLQLGSREISMERFLQLAFARFSERPAEQAEVDRPKSPTLSNPNISGMSAKQGLLQNIGMIYHLERPVIPKHIPFQTFTLNIPSSQIRHLYVSEEALYAGGLFGKGYLGPGRRGFWTLPLSKAGNTKETEQAGTSIVLGLSDDIPRSVKEGTIIWTLARLRVLIRQIRKMSQLSKWGMLDVFAAPCLRTQEDRENQDPTWSQSYCIKITCQASMSLMLRSVISEFACKLNEQGDECDDFAEEVDRINRRAGTKWLSTDKPGINLTWWDEIERREVLVA